MPALRHTTSAFEALAARRIMCSSLDTSTIAGIPPISAASSSVEEMSAR